MPPTFFQFELMAVLRVRNVANTFREGSLLDLKFLFKSTVSIFIEIKPLKNTGISGVFLATIMILNNIVIVNAINSSN